MSSIIVIVVVEHNGPDLTLHFEKDPATTVGELMEEVLAADGLQSHEVRQVRWRGREVDGQRRISEFAGARQQVRLHVIVGLGETFGSGLLDESFDLDIPTAGAAPAPAAAPMAAPTTLEAVEPALPSGSTEPLIANRTRSGSSPATPASPSTTVQRAHVRYYSKMRAQRVHPLDVELSREQVVRLIGKNRAQDSSAPFEADTAVPVRIEPILPGCQCYPPRMDVILDRPRTHVRFFVVPQVIGPLRDARVTLSQQGRQLSRIDLQCKVTRQTLSLAVGVMSFLAPAGSMLFKLAEGRPELMEALDLGLFLTVGGMLVGALSPDLLFLFLLTAAGLLYLWARPRRRQVGWDLANSGDA